MVSLSIVLFDALSWREAIAADALLILLGVVWFVVQKSELVKSL